MHPLSFFRRTNRAALRALSLAAVALMTTASPIASGQTAWPTKPVKIIVAAGAGSSVDVFARVLGDRLAQSLGQPFVVEPRPDEERDNEHNDLNHAWLHFGSSLSIPLPSASPTRKYVSALPNS